MSVSHVRGILSKEMANKILEELSSNKNQQRLDSEVLTPVLDRIFVKVRPVILASAVVLSLLILLNTLIIVGYVYSRKTAAL